jgi:KAP family P-loop domain
MDVADGTVGYKLILDVPSRRPVLGLPKTARALAEIVMESDPQFAIGIFGGWGSGKTTLMRAIEDHLDPSSAVAVQFNAWRYEKEEHLIVPLLDTIREALVAWGDAHPADHATAKRTAATIGKVTRSILAGVAVKVGLPHALELSFDANKALQARQELREEEEEARVPRSFYYASFRALRDAFAGFAGDGAGRRIVVFIDDLDRCLPSNALQVLESMKLFFYLQGFVFVVGLDQEVVQQVVELKYGGQAGAAPSAERMGSTRVSGEEYVKKIFQLPYRLAPVAPEHLEDFLSSAYAEAGLPQVQQDDLRQRVQQHLRYVAGHAGVNPREIKRYINAYTLQRRISDQLDPDVVLTLQTIAFRPDWRHVHDAILAYGPLLIEALARYAAGWTQAFEEFGPKLVVPDSLLEYMSDGRPGNVILSLEEDESHPGERKLKYADDIDKYIYRGEAVRTLQDPRLLDAIQSSGKAGQLLLRAKTADDPMTLVDEASRALVEGKLWSYLEFGSGSLSVRNLLERDLREFIRIEARLRESESDPQHRLQDLEELSRLATSMLDRLLDIYRAGAAGS